MSPPPSSPFFSKCVKPEVQKHSCVTAVVKAIVLDPHYLGGVEFTLQTL